SKYSMVCFPRVFLGASLEMDIPQWGHHLPNPELVTQMHDFSNFMLSRYNLHHIQNHTEIVITLFTRKMGEKRRIMNEKELADALELQCKITIHEHKRPCRFQVVDPAELPVSQQMKIARS